MDTATDLIIPIYNEEKNISFIRNLIGKHGYLFHTVILVNDGSTDKTKEEILKLGEEFQKVKIIHHSFNKGNGASVKSGIYASNAKYCMIIDADGQHDAEEIPNLIAQMNDADLVIAHRKNIRYSFTRNIGNALLNFLASFLSGRNIPDLTCGFRIFKRNYALQFMHLFPDKFSFPATSCLAFISNNYTVKFHSVQSLKRLSGTSKINPLMDGIRFLVILFRMIFFFYPLKVFVPLSVLNLLMGIIWAIYTFHHSRQISAVSAIFFITSFLILVFAILAEQLNNLRKEINNLHSRLLEKE